MVHHRSCLFLLPLLSNGASAELLGPTYPAPVDLAGEGSPVLEAFKNVTSQLEAYLERNGEGLDDITKTSLAGLENVTFSVGAFSLHDPAVADSFQFHHTSAEVAENANGTDEVDGDSIYHLASITKLFTVYAGLLQLTEEQWNTPLSDCIPVLGQYLQEHSDDIDPTLTTQWDKITPWSLANQVAGVARPGPLYVDPAALGVADLVSLAGLPPAPDFVELIASCVTPDCTEDGYAESVAWQAPELLPWWSPAYSNGGFILLGVAITHLLGKSWRDIYNDAVFVPLGMTSSVAGAPAPGSPEASRSAIADSLGFFAVTGDLIASGGIYSSLNDLSIFGTAILNSTQLPALSTRKWMKPSAHTASVNNSVGAPWEILRYTSAATGKVTDLYTKSGGAGEAHTHIVLVPDYDFGFSYLSTSTDAASRALVVTTILDGMTAALLPALEAQAALEASTNFAGTYESTDDNLNSSVTIAFTGTPPALVITGWISNGTEVLPNLFPTTTDVPARLQMMIPDQGNRRVSFQFSQQPSSMEVAKAGLFAYSATALPDWIVLGGNQWAGRNTNLFVFEVDGEGRATRVSPVVTRAVLGRRQE